MWWNPLLNYMQKYTNLPSNRSLCTSTSRQPYKEINNLQKLHINRSNNNMFPTETLSFQALQQTSLVMTYYLVSTPSMLFWEDRQNIQLKKEKRQSTLRKKSLEITVNKILETITSNGNDINNKVPTQETTNEEYLLNLFKQYSNFTQQTSEWLGTATPVVIIDAFIQEIVQTTSL